LPLTHRVDNHSQACTFQKRMASSQKDMEPQGRESDAPVRTRRRSGTLGLRKTTLESRVHVQTVGLNAKKIISALSQGKTFLLTFPFIGSLRAASGLRQSNLYSKPSAAIAGHPRGGDFCSIRNRASPPFRCAHLPRNDIPSGTFSSNVTFVTCNILCSGHLRCWSEPVFGRISHSSDATLKSLVIRLSGWPGERQNHPEGHCGYE